MTAPFHKTNHNSPAPQYTMSSKTFIKQEPVPVFYSKEYTPVRAYSFKKRIVVIFQVTFNDCSVDYDWRPWTAGLSPC